MLLRDYTSIRGEGRPHSAKKTTWNLFHAYIDAHSQILIDGCTGYGAQAISRLKCQCENMTFSGQSRYSRMFQQVLHKGGEPAINYIIIFHNAKSLAVSVGNIYTEDQLNQNFLDSLHKGRNYYAQIETHQ